MRTIILLSFVLALAAAAPASAQSTQNTTGTQGTQGSQSTQGAQSTQYPTNPLQVIGIPAPGSTESATQAPPPALAPSQQQNMSTLLQQAAPVPEALVPETGVTGQRVFGQWLFQGRFAQQSFLGFNPDYLISVGDTIQLRLWGAYTLDVVLTVDAQGNIFIPSVGPVNVLNVRNGDLNDAVLKKVRTVYRGNVSVYASLAQAQPVKVFVSGGVKRPGLYPAFASDSLLHFLDAAGGIDPLSGSYLDVRVIRNGETLRTVNLYDFLTTGSLSLIQFRDGDTIFVGPIHSTVQVTGLVAMPAQFEFNQSASLYWILRIAGVDPRATNVRLTRNMGHKRDVKYMALSDDLGKVSLEGGDEIKVIADRLVGKIIVSVEGEHEGSGQYVMPYDATLKDLLSQVKFTAQSRQDSIQLYRQSIATRQKQMLDTMLEKLQEATLTARSETSEEALLRGREADLMLKFIDQARNVVPKGQLVLGHDYDPTNIALEDGDVIRIPRRTSLVAVHGEVFFPNSFVFQPDAGVESYIAQAGGMTQSGDKDRILVLKPDGEVKIFSDSRFFSSTPIDPGDEILVLPKVDKKRFQFAKDVMQIIYQFALAAGVVLRL